MKTSNNKDKLSITDTDLIFGKLHNDFPRPSDITSKNPLNDIITNIMLKLIDSKPKQNINYENFWDSRYKDFYEKRLKDIREEIAENKSCYDYSIENAGNDEKNIKYKKDCKIYKKFLDFFLCKFEKSFAIFHEEFKQELQMVFVNFFQEISILFKEHKKALKKEKDNTNSFDVEKVEKANFFCKYQQKSEFLIENKKETLHKEQKNKNACNLNNLIENIILDEGETTNSNIIEKDGICNIKAQKDKVGLEDEKNFNFKENCSIVIIKDSSTSSDYSLNNYRKLIHSKIYEADEIDREKFKDSIFEIHRKKKNMNGKKTCKILRFYIYRIYSDKYYFESYFFENLLFFYFFLGSKKKNYLDMKIRKYKLSLVSKQSKIIILSNALKMYKLIQDAYYKIRHLFRKFNSKVGSLYLDEFNHDCKSRFYRKLYRSNSKDIQSLIFFLELYDRRSPAFNLDSYHYTFQLDIYKYREDWFLYLFDFFNIYKNYDL